MNSNPNPAQAIADLPTVETLHGTRWVSLRHMVDPERGIHGYDFLHEDRANGVIVAVLPIRFLPNGEMEYLLRREITPCWSLQPRLSALTGGSEGDDSRLDIVRELEEEAGYLVPPEALTFLGTCRGQKSSTNIYRLYTVNLTHVERGEPTNDDPEDTVNQGVAESVWVSRQILLEVEDAQVSVMALRIPEVALRVAGVN